MLELSNADLQPIEWQGLPDKDCRADVLRLDKLHPVVSGNKWYKLKYHLEAARMAGKTSLVTFGGAWSNHIVATAFAANAYGLGSTGIIRGERPSVLSATLQKAQEYGMELVFVSREAYRLKEADAAIALLISWRPDAHLVPEGGAGPEGIRGCMEIPLPAGTYTHILCAIGTGTLFRGLLQATGDTVQLVGIPVLKGLELPLPPEHRHRASLHRGYHFGGYAHKTPELLQFMNAFYRYTGIPTDFVYTGKLMYAFSDLLQQGVFAPGSRLLLIHSGGLQGNISLEPGTLEF